MSNPRSTTHTTSKFPGSAARFANGVRSEAICGHVGTAITPSTFTTGAGRSGTPSKRRVSVRRAYISGSGRRASIASCGQGTSTGMNLDELLRLEWEVNRKDE